MSDGAIVAPAGVAADAASSSAPAAAAAAAAPSSAAAASASSAPRIDVEIEPSMAEQLEDQKSKAAEIAQLRAMLAEHNQINKDALLVREFESSDRVAWRFLKARKYDLEKTAAMFTEAVAARKAKQLDTILDRPCPKGLEYKVVSKHGWHGYDKYGRPIFIKNTGRQDFPALSATGTLEERVYYNAYLNEYVRQVVVPEANARVRVPGDAPIDQVVIIVNLRNFGMHCIKQHNYSWVREIAAHNGLLFPETAGTTMIINAPRIFTMVWSIVKGWLDERTRNKVQIVSGDGSKELRATLGEECFRNLPKEIGGECACMNAEDVPKHGDGCMLGHPMSVKFINHMKKANDAAGIPNTYNPPEATAAAEAAAQEEATPDEDAVMAAVAQEAKEAEANQ